MSEEQVCKEIIEQVGYQEFYRYFQEKTTLIEQQNKEIERLNDIINDIKGQLNYLETYSSKEDVFEDMKRRLDRIESIVNRK